jgi:(5-formylfuran-3-yl)methyl phosphate synthase
MTGLLASVTSVSEARIALAGGADIIDVKDPAQGALGAADPAVIAAVVREVAGHRAVSATVGDLPLDADRIAAAVARTAATGVHYVKVGVFGRELPRSVLEALAAYAADGVRIVAVLFADRSPDLNIAARVANAGLAGVMLDTADKRAGSLRDVLTDGGLQTFVSAARGSGLLTGLAGSLRLDDIPSLLALAPDYLGFRGALCAGQRRTAELNPEALRTVRARLSQHGGLGAGVERLQRPV